MSARNSGFERRHVELLADILQPIVQTRIGIGVFGPHHADHLARPKRHADHIAGFEFEPARHAIRIGTVERDGHQHIDDTRR